MTIPLDTSLFNNEQLLPCVVQNALSGKVIMLAYMNEAAFKKTLTEKRLCFYSRSRQRLWTKGETSGNYLELIRLSHDCDADTLLAEVLPLGPSCHMGTETCFDNGFIFGASHSGSIFERLMTKLKERAFETDPNSYTRYLMRSGLDKILKKVAEEAGEVIIAAKNSEPEPLIEELSDLIYHLWILILNKEIELESVEFKLHDRLLKNGNLKK